MKGLGAFFEKWGYYLMALLCAGVIVFSTIWMKERPAPVREDAPAAADQSQRLSEVRQEKQERILIRPVPGEIIRMFSESPVYDEAFGIWAVHPALDFYADEGEKVLAMMDGCAKITEEGLEIHGEAGERLIYRGLAGLLTENGRQVKAGDVIGHAGGIVPLEGGRPHICICYIQQGQRVDFASLIKQ